MYYLGGWLFGWRQGTRISLLAFATAGGRRLAWISYNLLNWMTNWLSNCFLSWLSNWFPNWLFNLKPHWSSNWSSNNWITSTEEGTDMFPQQRVGAVQEGAAVVSLTVPNVRMAVRVAELTLTLLLQ